jgi:hypothetical protein
MEILFFSNYIFLIQNGLSIYPITILQNNCRRPPGIHALLGVDDKKSKKYL